MGARHLVYPQRLLYPLEISKNMSEYIFRREYGSAVGDIMEQVEDEQSSLPCFL